MGTADQTEPSASELRSRARRPEDATVDGCEKPTKPSDGPPKSRKTYGRIPSTGRTFVVPNTHDMVSTLLSPTQPKNLSDIVILTTLALHIVLFFTLPHSFRTPVLLVLFVFWRTSYNVGIGYLLKVQSKHKQLVHWAQKYGIFDASRQPTLYKFIKHELEFKITHEVKNGDYVFDEAPIEYNTWLVFRRVVDLILMCDFVSYVLMAMSCAHIPDGEGWGLTVGRWLGGIVLFLFNLWVKLDAHRVVKDFAWYWGDFFFLIDQNLTFDGVYEIAPHPMYSVGYAGYYGISLMAASYTVLFASLVAHAAQFAFLTFVENPHIEKTYNPPAPRRKSALATPDSSMKGLVGAQEFDSVEDFAPALNERPLLQKPDLLNSTHFSTMLLLFYGAAMTVLTPNNSTIQGLFIINALAWRFWHTVGIGAILVGQSQNKLWVRHFLKFGETREDAWRQWKGMYYVSLCMCHASYVAAAWKLYNFPTGDDRMVLFRHTLGVMLIALQIWTAFSIHDSLGEFGWFYGDFFFDHPRPHLTYSGIYRYLNNPERLIGCAGIWGIVLIASSPAIFLIGLFSHVCSLLFINVVERPHMQKLYGSQIRREAGVERTIRKAIPPPIANHVKSFQGSMDKVLAEASDFVEELLENARPHRLPKTIMGVVKDTQALLSQYPARLSITLLADDLAKYDIRKYSVSVVNAVRQHGSGCDVKKSLAVPLGEPIRVMWTAPTNHSRKDWIGLYRIADNSSREVTRIASMGRWVAICKDQNDTNVPDQGIISSDIRSVSEDGEELCKGEVEFTGNKLFWRNGVYELRYHHDGKHNVMAISLPFEIMVNTVELDEEDIRGDGGQVLVENSLLPVVQRCFENNPDYAPSAVDEEFGGLGDEKYAKRVVYAVKEMFGVDFAPEVVKADGNVRKLAWRICNARKVLSPFSMNKSNSASPPSNSPPATPKMESAKLHRT